MVYLLKRFLASVGIFSSPVELEKRAKRSFVNETENGGPHMGSKSHVTPFVCLSVCLFVSQLNVNNSLSSWWILTILFLIESSLRTLQFHIGIVSKIEVDRSLRSIDHRRIAFFDQNVSSGPQHRWHDENLPDLLCSKALISQTMPRCLFFPVFDIGRSGRSVEIDRSTENRIFDFGVFASVAYRSRLILARRVRIWGLFLAPGLPLLETVESTGRPKIEFSI